MGNARGKGLLAAAAIGAGIGLAGWLGQRRQQRGTGGLEAALAAAPAGAGRVDFAALDSLPAPVRRYLRKALKDGQPLIRLAHFGQSGTIRTSANGRWMDFSARQLVSPFAPGFLWNARIGAMPLVHLRVIDAYTDGHGASNLYLLSALSLASAAQRPEMDAGSLHRYLAEAPFYPTALLPSESLRWNAIDEHRAQAMLTHGAVSVSLEFRFNEQDEVTGVYTPGRWCAAVDGGFQLKPWEGRFSNWVERDGMRVPSAGEVGWHEDGGWQPVWRGSFTEAAYEMAA